MQSDAYTKSVAALAGLGPMRVWSLLVTVFGDLAPEEAIPGPILSIIMDELGIRPEATRVALHRLRSDGWITSEKVGRTSLHQLSPKGRRDSNAARPVIYGRHAPDGPAHFALFPQGSTPKDTARFLDLGGRLYACAAGTALPPDTLAMTAHSVPEWVCTALEPLALRNGYEALHAALETVSEIRDVANPMQCAVLRVLIVHAWRRLALRHPLLPAQAHSQHWLGHACRTRVLDLLDRLDRPTLDTIAGS